jgi:small subunit ribosomal protein S11
MEKKIITKKYTMGCAYIHSTHNNTLITITNSSGDTLTWSSSGAAGFKKSKRSTSYAAQAAAELAAKKAIEIGLESVKIFIKGLGEGRESAIRGIQSAGLSVTLITDTTSIPHNGCRLPKRRRI